MTTPEATPRPWVLGTWTGRCHIQHANGHPGPPGCKYDVELQPDLTDITNPAIPQSIVAGQWDYEQGGILKPADANLIVEAVSNFDRLRRIEAAARALVEGHDHGDLGVGPIWCDGQCEPINALRAALDEESQS